MDSYITENLDELWKNTLHIIKNNKYFDEPVYHTWIKDSKLFSVDNNIAVITVPFKLNKQIMEQSIDVIQSTLSSVLKNNVTCSILLEQDVEVEKHFEKPSIDFVDKVNIDYNFENFIVGKNNREAQAAALAVCYYPGKFNNPLFIYGNSGLGKTHLLHAIANYIKEHRPNEKVLYIYSEDFVTLLIESMKNRNVEEIKKKISEADYLLIDDIQRLQQSTSQEIFFNLYNKLIGDNKQIVITSDIHPNELKGIENRLISRFSSGLSVSIGSPEFETAKAILQKKIEGREDTVMIDSASLDYIATKFSSDVRKLEGTLNELFFKSILYKPDVIDLAFTKEIFKENPMIMQEGELTSKKIKNSVCEFYGLTKSQLESKSRTKNISNARHIAIYLCRTYMDMPFAKIGMEFGNRDHSTIMSSYEKTTTLMKESSVLKQAVMQIEKQLGLK